MSISVADHVEIQRLMYRYAHCADNKDYDGFAGVFCEDAEFDLSGTVITPLAAIRSMMQVLDNYTSTLHQVHNTLYEVEGDVASGETYCLASHLLDVSGETKKVEMGIIYQDRLRRTPAGWRIVRRRFRLLWTQTATVDR